MKRTLLRIFSYMLVALIAAGTTLGLCLHNHAGSENKLQQLEDLLLTRFIGEADQEAMEDAAAAAMVQALGDRWSYYMTADTYEAYCQAMTNSYVGVGITIRKNDDGAYDILEVTPDAPAEEAGVRGGDVLAAVDGQSVSGMEQSDVGDLVRGKEGTSVKLTVLRDGESMEFTLERRKFQTPVATYQMLEGDIGLITIENFDERCAEETIEAVEALQAQGARSLIFDVRNNPGGYKNELVKVLDHLLPEGPLFKTEDYLGREAVDTSDADCVTLPMAVLVNADSYSAAEFFAAALREYDAAVVVGEQTCGKGYFQTTFSLSDGSAVNLSIGKYYTPKGENLARVGLKPDVEAAVSDETAANIAAGTLAPVEDPQILAAIDALT